MEAARYRWLLWNIADWFIFSAGFGLSLTCYDYLHEWDNHPPRPIVSIYATAIMFGIACAMLRKFSSPLRFAIWTVVVNVAITVLAGLIFLLVEQRQPYIPEFIPGFEFWNSWIGGVFWLGGSDGIQPYLAIANIIFLLVASAGCFLAALMAGTLKWAISNVVASRSPPPAH